jgi:glycosyltransferase involved in cell wall biosynthesis
MALTISIVTPTYKQEQWIAQTIESILSQEGDFFIDYIIVNDGSPDNTHLVVEKYEKMLQEGTWSIACNGIEFRHWKKENGGQASAVNAGLAVATGDVCAWMNSDDYYYPGAFAAVAKQFEQDPELDFLYADCMHLYEDGGKPNTIEPRPKPCATLETLKTRGNSFALNFFSKRIYDQTGPLDESLRYCADLDQWFRIFACGKVEYLPFTVGAFRLWSQSHTMTNQSGFDAERKEIAKRYGANIIPKKHIHKLRQKIPGIDVFKHKMPSVYEGLKSVFYRVVDVFQYH